MKYLNLLLVSLFAVNAWAAGDLTDEMDALGANKDLLKRARAIDPDNQVRVVQNRDVDRYNRIELGVNAGLSEGGDSYVNTNLLGGSLDYHFTPHWSLGVRYETYNNSLSSQGNNVFSNAAALKAAGDTYTIPQVDYAKSSWLTVAEWYPLYGKINLADYGISQFDIYMLGGAGVISLSSGSSPLYSAGGGMAFWLSQHFTTRLEARWQGYTDQVYNGNRNINETILGLSIGFLL